MLLGTIQEGNLVKYDRPNYNSQTHQTLMHSLDSYRVIDGLMSEFDTRQYKS